LEYNGKTPAHNLLEEEIAWLGEILINRLSYQFNGEKNWKKIDEFIAPAIIKGRSKYDEFLLSNNLNLEERVVFILALIPHIVPQYLDNIVQQNMGKAGDFPQLGGIRGKNHRGFLPTGETVMFLLSGSHLSMRFIIQHIFSEDHFFAKKQILWIEDPVENEPKMSGKLSLSQEIIDWVTLEKLTRPRFGMNFPAKRIETKMEWSDLVLNDQTMLQVQELETWVKHGETLLNTWGMSKKLKPGYRVLFHGPPGTGKTLTATLIGKYTGKDVYKIDLSMVISKYIGETEKNLSSLFDKAANKDWILFFDEADALFGKRTGVKDAHDKYANQEVSYLLQRTEEYPGLVILASNYKSNIDDAFTRRFQSFIYFPPPKASERISLWKNAFPKDVSLDTDVNLTEIAKKHDLTGAHIMNIVQFACLQTLSRKETIVSHKDISKGIEKEFLKEGKFV